MKAILQFLKKPLVKITISLLIIAALIVWLPWEELSDTLKKLSLTVWLTVFSGFIVGHLIGTVKWRLLINMGKSSLSVWLAVRCYFAGLFANLFLPSLAGGDIIKTGLAIRYNNEKGMTIFATVLDRIIDTASVVFLIIVSAFLSPKFLQPQDQKLVYLIIAMFSGLILSVGFFILIPVEKVKHEKISKILKRAKEIFAEVYKNPIRPVAAFFLSLTVQATFILLTIYLAGILEIHIPFVLWFLVWPLAKLSALLPVSMGGIGVREVALTALLSRLAVPATDAVALGFLWESILISGGIFGGLLYLTSNIFSKQTIPSLRSISEPDEQLKDLS